ncbi:MAG: hypothetical protein WCJ09_18150 [Planctomycetota bacterium]
MADRAFSQIKVAWAPPGYLCRSAIGGIERGERNIESIAQTLGITLAELMEGL